MFTGIGGFELGLKHSSLDHTSVGYSEIDKYAISIFEKHFKGVKNYGDATTIEPWRIPDFDLLVGGFPCQAFSVAGKQQGFNDTRGTLFFDIARVCAEKRPRYLVLENVKGLLSHDSGKTFQTILGVLADLGYRVEWQVLNSKDFGVPQNRERVFIVGHLGERSGQEIFPLTGTSKTFTSQVIDYEVRSIMMDHAKQNGRLIKENEESAFTLTTLDRQGVMLKEITKGQSQGQRIYDSSGLATTLASQAGGLGAKTGLYSVQSKEKTMGDILEGKVKQENFIDIINTKGKSKNKNIASTITGGGHSGGNHSDMDLLVTPVVTSGRKNKHQRGIRIRRLIPLECERLQGFPDGWTAGLSDTQRYKTLGNAVTVPVVTAVINQLVATFTNNKAYKHLDK